MACGTVISGTGGLADNTFFGVEADEGGLMTQQVQVTRTSDPKQGRDACGRLVAVAFYNKKADVSIEGLDTRTSGKNPGVVLTLSSTTLSAMLPGAMYIDEVTVDRSNEDFAKTSIKATAYDKM